MAKTDVKNAVIAAGNTNATLVTKLTRINQKILYGKTQVPPLINFANSTERNKFLAEIKTFTQDPSLANAVFMIQCLNSYDLCNPFMFIVSQAFPPGSPVANVFSGVQTKINEIVSAFENFSLTDGAKQAQATVRDSLSNVSTLDLAFGGEGLVNTPFQTGKLFFNIQTTDVLSNGANVTITQLEDNKIKASMVGQIEQVTPGSNGSKNISVNVTNIFPPNPPTLEDGETPRTFSRFNIEYETKTSTDVRQLSEDLQGITDALRSIGILEVAAELNNLPDFIPGVSKIKAAILDVAGFIEDIDAGTDTITDVTGTAGDALAGNIPTVEVIRRVRILRDFYDKIRPFTNLNFAIQSFFEDEIEGINRFLRDAIPYDQLAYLVGIVVTIARAINGVLNYIIGILKIISSFIKVVTVVLKVIRIVVKVLKLVIKGIPSITTTVGVQEKLINTVGGLEEGIDQAIKTLQSMSKDIDAILRQLQLTKRYLENFIKEGAKLQATLESCPGLNDSRLDTIMNQANRNGFDALRILLNNVPVLDTNVRYGNDGTSTGTNNNGPGTFVITEGGTIVLLTDTVFGYDEFGNIVFYGDLVSLSTGVNFENTLGQEFRSGLQYYTFNKFKNLDSAGNLIQKAEELFLAKQTRIADPEDVFGNFQELYLGYTLKIQEEKRTDENSQILVRRRGIALDSTGKIVASTELTFSTDLSGIIQELKITLNQFIQQGIIGINTPDTNPNEVSDDDAINLADSYGANPLGLNNLKANSNSLPDVGIGSSNTGTSTGTGGITGVSSNIGEENIETRIGNEPFSSPNTTNKNTTVQGIPLETPTNTELQITSDTTVNNRTVNIEKLTTNSLNTFINENPTLKTLSDTFSTLSRISPKQLSEVLSQPGAENISEEELVINLKEQILSSIDPNPERVKEVQQLTRQFLDALEGTVRLEYEAATRNFPYKFKPSFQEYYDRVEPDKLQQFIRSLQAKGFTDTEIQLGIGNEELGDKYKIKIDGTKVTVRRR